VECEFFTLPGRCQPDSEDGRYSLDSAPRVFYRAPRVGPDIVNAMVKHRPPSFQRVLTWIVLLVPALTAPLRAAVVSASCVHPGDYRAEYAFDGNMRTRWASAIAPGKPAWLVVDFGRSVPIPGLSIHWERARAADYDVQTSDDGKHWKTVGEHRNCKGSVDTISGLAAQGRYLRIHCLRHGRWDLSSIWEVELHGLEAKATLAGAAEEAYRAEQERARKRREDLAGVFDELGVREIVFAARECGVDGHWYANFGYYANSAERKCYRAGGRLCKLDVASGEVVCLVEDPGGSVRDPAVHYDAEKILFSWRKAGSETFHLHEINVDGTGLRQLTDGIYDDIEPTYLPDGDIMFVSGRCRRWVNCWLTQVGVLYRCDADGGNVRQISANVEHDNTPWVLPDGRVLYQRWEYVDRSQVHYHHLWTANPDGTGQMVFFGNLHPGGVFIDAKPIPGTDEVILINSPGHGAREHAGYVATVTDRFGPDRRDAMKNISPRRFRDPFPLNDTAFIVARSRKMVLMDRQGNCVDIYELPKAYGNAELHEPRPLIKRPRERIIPPRIDLAKDYGTLVLSDIYFGRNMQGVERGEIKKLLVLESLPKPINFTGGMDPLSYGGTFTLERLVGTVPVDEDGSAYMRLPANRAFFFVALDGEDSSVKRMQSFLTVMPGEKASCVGCHEERGETPVSKQELGRLLALQRPPSEPERIAGVPEVIDFPRDVQPIFDRHCLKCHDYDKRAGGVIMTGDRGPMFSHSYATLTIRRQVADGRNYPRSNYAPRELGTAASPLMKKINGDHPSSPESFAAAGHKVHLSQDEQDMIRYWIESAAAYPGTYAALGCGAIGGYAQNRLVHKDDGWPTAKPFRAVIEKRCLDCHKKVLELPLPRSMSDEIGLSFWKPSWSDKRLRFSRHLMFNLTRPEKSLLLLAPLPKEAGGLGLCREGSGSDAQPATVFADTGDPDYRSVRAHIEAGRDYLENELKRFDMPDFKPRPEYVREMKRYGVLPEAFDLAVDLIDVYETDRRYWESLWYRRSGE